jgi:hypothetical protein
MGSFDGISSGACPGDDNRTHVQRAAPFEELATGGERGARRLDVVDQKSRTADHALRLVQSERALYVARASRSVEVGLAEGLALTSQNQRSCRSSKAMGDRPSEERRLVVPALDQPARMKRDRHDDPPGVEREVWQMAVDACKQRISEVRTILELEASERLGDGAAVDEHGEARRVGVLGAHEGRGAGGAEGAMGTDADVARRAARGSDEPAEEVERAAGEGSHAFPSARDPSGCG